MQLTISELRLLLAAAERTNRPVDVDWNNHTLTILEHEGNGALKLYQIRDNLDGTATIKDRTDNTKG